MIDLENSIAETGHGRILEVPLNTIRPSPDAFRREQKGEREDAAVLELTRGRMLRAINNQVL